MTRDLRPLPDLPAAGGPPPWLGYSPTGEQLGGMPLDWFHRAVDQLAAETVGERYWRKVVASRQAEAWEVR